MHFGVAGDAEVNSRQNQFPESEYPTALKNAAERHDDSSSYLGTQPDLKTPVILCVDDTPSVLEGQRMLLEENGFRVLAATNGKEAVQAFVTNSVDLVLLDYHMPGMDGDTAASHMRAVKADVPIALLSGDDRLPGKVLHGVDCFISKSEPISSFLEKVHHLLCLRASLQGPDASMNRNSPRRSFESTALSLDE